jgi:hypothetical protein
MQEGRFGGPLFLWMFVSCADGPKIDFGILEIWKFLVWRKGVGTL